MRISLSNNENDYLKKFVLERGSKLRRRVIVRLIAPLMLLVLGVEMEKNGMHSIILSVLAEVTLGT